MRGRRNLIIRPLSGCSVPTNVKSHQQKLRHKRPHLLRREIQNAPHLHPAPTASISPHSTPQKNGFSACLPVFICSGSDRKARINSTCRRSAFRPLRRPLRPPRQSPRNASPRVRASLRQRRGVRRAHLKRFARHCAPMTAGKRQNLSLFLVASAHFFSPYPPLPGDAAQSLQFIRNADGFHHSAPWRDASARGHLFLSSDNFLFSRPAAGAGEGEEIVALSGRNCENIWQKLDFVVNFKNQSCSQTPQGE